MSVLRFAPSPTGYLHVGNARVALANWLIARRDGGRFLLRLDDTDTERCKPEYASAIEEDLRWLGLDWDAMFRQSDRLDRYAAAAERLKATGRLYPCFESEEELAFKRERARRQGRPPVYDREALKMTPEQRARAEAKGKKPYWRFRLSMGTVSWRDGVLGERSVKLPTLSDPVLIRADGSPLYTFTSVVDDIEMGVTHIVRGEDHVTNTGIQLDIWAALGGDVTRIAFAHLPLLTDEAGGPLSKRVGSVSLRQLRRDGVEPAALAGYLAALGTSRDPVAAMPAALAAGYDIGTVSKSPARFDTRQMLALNRRHLQGLPFEAVRDRLPAGASEAFWLAIRDNLDLLSEARLWWEVTSGEIDAPPQPEDAAYLAQALRLLPETLDAEAWRGWTQALAAATGRKGKALYRPLRIALTGETEGPDMAALLPLIGRARAAARLARAAERTGTA
jgi:glutamyl-tRNA synthetase